MVITDEGLARGGIVTFTVANKTPAQVKNSLTKQGINVSVSDGSGSLVSFVQRGLTEVVRASVHYFNTESEVDYFEDSLKKIVSS